MPSTAFAFPHAGSHPFIELSALIHKSQLGREVPFPILGLIPCFNAFGEACAFISNETSLLSAFFNCSYFILVILYCPVVRENQSLRLSVVLGDVFNMWPFIAFCQVIIFFYRQGILVFHSSQGMKTK